MKTVIPPSSNCFLSLSALQKSFPAQNWILNSPVHFEKSVRVNFHFRRVKKAPYSNRCTRDFMIETKSRETNKAGKAEARKVRIRDKRKARTGRGRSVFPSRQWLGRERPPRRGLWPFGVPRAHNSAEMQMHWFCINRRERESLDAFHAEDAREINGLR